MKEAIGGISIFEIVFVFILLFTGIMCLTINFSRAYGVKDELLNIIQRDNTIHGELGDETIQAIANHLQKAGHMITGRCPDSYEGYDRSGNKSSNAVFCIKTTSLGNTFDLDAEEKCSSGICEAVAEGDIGMLYYNIVLFYQLDIPLLNTALNLKLRGSTKVMFWEV